MGPVGGLHDRSCAPARGRGPQKGAPAGEPADHAIGRSRGGLTTKIHLAADGRCRPLAFVLAAGQAGDALAFTAVMARLRVPRPRGRPRTRPDVVLADKAYSSRAIRDHLRARGIRTVIPIPADQAREPAAARQPRRQAARLRPRGIQAAQHRRAVHQPPQAVARHRHPLREDRHHLPRRTAHRRHLPLVRPLIQTRLPSGTSRRGCRCGR
ncbi:transposase [Streptomyces sp. R44]|uniref:Transposase n=1 Tax=Streptomyces sp. R44 TaxID=3238633 RepID=A0AB39TC61_9ACTN